MSGLVDRRNQSTYWLGTITWSRLKLKNLPRCSHCWLNVHAAGGADTRIPLARWRRTNTYAVPDAEQGHPALRAVLELCDVHRQDWLDWTPGQMTLGNT